MNSAKPTAFGIATDFLKQPQYCKDGMLCLRFFQGRFYKFNDSHYKALSDEDLGNDVMAFLQGTATLQSFARKANKTDVVENLKGICRIDSETPPDTWIDSGKHARELLAVKNGLLDLDAFIVNGSTRIYGHSPEFWCRSVIETKWDQVATCPKWDGFLNEILPDKDDRNLLQEWFGANLTLSAEFQKFMIFEGQGANGKSVVCTVLEALLGSENCSALALEFFDPRYPFALISTENKRANIVSELSEMDRVAEGRLKQFVSGDRMQVDRKFKDSVMLAPTAKCTFSTNVLPPFRDRSKGVWRRMELIYFGKVIPDEKKDLRLTSIEYWKDTGELPGILNWSLNGLRRLKTSKSTFTRSARSKELLAKYEEESNPARMFLEDFYIERPSVRTLRQVIYKEYHEQCKSMGGHPLNEANFAKEVKRLFPRAFQLPNPVQVGGIRGRAWENLARRQDSYSRPSDDSTDGTANPDFNSSLETRPKA
jgi:putative DNA primase/helicase